LHTYDNGTPSVQAVGCFGAQREAGGAVITGGNLKSENPSRPDILEVKNDLFEDFDLALWPLVREELGKLDRRIKKATKKTLVMAEREGL